MPDDDALLPGDHYLEVARRMQELHALVENGRPVYTDVLVARRMRAAGRFGRVSRNKIIGMRNAKSYHGAGREAKNEPPSFLIGLALVGYELGEDKADYFLRPSEQPPAPTPVSHVSAPPDGRWEPSDEIVDDRLAAVFDRLGVVGHAARQETAEGLLDVGRDGDLIRGLERLADRRARHSRPAASVSEDTGSE